MSERIPLSVNWHLWPKCNYCCKFCFARFRGQKHESLEEALITLTQLGESGVKKITFAGGEPTLCPFLCDLLRHAKGAGLTTMVVTNGTRIDEKFLSQAAGCLDWVALSIDSASECVEKQLGRGHGRHIATVMRAAGILKEHHVRLKINTVVTNLNWNEDMHDLITHLAPERWKVFQFLPIQGENDRYAPQLTVSDDRFRCFVRRHADLDPVAENNDAMTRSYVMLDPQGRVFQNSNGRYCYSQPIRVVGLLNAIREVGWEVPKFLSRRGYYDWSHNGGEV